MIVETSPGIYECQSCGAHFDDWAWAPGVGWHKSTPTDCSYCGFLVETTKGPQPVDEEFIEPIVVGS